MFTRGNWHSRICRGFRESSAKRFGTFDMLWRWRGTDAIAVRRDHWTSSGRWFAPRGDCATERPCFARGNRASANRATQKSSTVRVRCLSSSPSEQNQPFVVSPTLFIGVCPCDGFIYPRIFDLPEYGNSCLLIVIDGSYVVRILKSIGDGLGVQLGLVCTEPSWSDWAKGKFLNIQHPLEGTCKHNRIARSIEIALGPL
jgi:hypothetical protein